MIWLNPESVELGGVALGNVTLIASSRKADRVVAEHDDTGPWVVFADVPERRAEFEVRRLVTGDEGPPAALGDSVELAFVRAPSASDSSRRRISATVVVTSITHSLRAGRGLEQVIACVAVSPTGTTDPITETPLEG